MMIDFSDGSMKKCFKCGRELPLDSFYTHSRMKDGHLNKCKECTILDMRMHREKNGDKIRAYDRASGGDRHLVKFGDKFPEKRRAQIAVGNAIRDGKMCKPLFCTRCLSPGNVQAHHRDYSKPLDVVWLCQKCHVEEHALRVYDCGEVATLRRQSSF